MPFMPLQNFCNKIKYIKQGLFLLNEIYKTVRNITQLEAVESIKRIKLFSLLKL